MCCGVMSKNGYLGKGFNWGPSVVPFRVTPSPRKDWYRGRWFGPTGLPQVSVYT